MLVKPDTPPPEPSNFFEARVSSTRVAVVPTAITRRPVSRASVIAVIALPETLYASDEMIFHAGLTYR